ncbi:MAG: threonine--tRNA ligase [Acidobacteria bacterium]|nr:threonine--tRNA ligase [Acidobacteriota bacterium]
MNANESIRVRFPDGTEKLFPKGVTPLAVAQSLGPRLADAALVAKVNGRLVDLNTPLTEDTPLRVLTARDPEALEVYRHSSAHVLAAAVLELYPETKLGIGPPTGEGFFYDFQRDTPFTPEDLGKIEARMRDIVQRDLPFERVWLPREESLKKFAGMGEQMKCELIEEKAEGDRVSCYTTGPHFIDFCRGPHLPSTGKIKALKLLSIAGAYWKGDERNARMQRIYGTSFFTPQELDAYLHKIEEAKKRDHRKLGPELDLFSIQEAAGPGLIFWHPKGGIVRKIMEDWMRDQYLRRGYGLVYTPHVAREHLWKISGHLNYFADNMYAAIELDDANYRLKPMNCPGHILIYKDRLRSYRDLPIRLGELGTVYRYERSGVMHGLMRVRGFTQDDAHIFCTPSQIKDEIIGCMDFALDVLRTFGFQEYKVELSTWDNGASGKRLWQLSTVQFDFTLPRRFELEYIAEDGKAHQPLMVHRALWGSVERFFGVLLEHYAGAFPLWLAPVQAVVMPITDKQLDYARSVAEKLRAAGLRIELDARNEKINLKIREAQLQKIPYMLVAGQREAEKQMVAVRDRKRGDLGAQPIDEFLAEAQKLIDSKT